MTNIDFLNLASGFLGTIFNIILSLIPVLALGYIGKRLLDKYMDFQKERDEKQAVQNQIVPQQVVRSEDTQSMSFSMRMQAYERLALLCERASLENVILRVRNENMSAADLKMALMVGIQQEYDHNVSQQVYVSENLWKIVQFAKNDTINIVNVVAKSLPENASGQQLSKAIFKYLGEAKETALDKARSAISQEASVVLQHK